MQWIATGALVLTRTHTHNCVTDWLNSLLHSVLNIGVCVCVCARVKQRGSVWSVHFRWAHGFPQKRSRSMFALHVANVSLIRRVVAVKAEAQTNGLHTHTHTLHMQSIACGTRAAFCGNHVIVSSNCPFSHFAYWQRYWHSLFFLPYKYIYF